MSDEEDYLSDKFLVEAAASASSSQPQTYAQRRQEAQKQSRIKNEQNRLRSRRQREQESREEGLRKSLFDRTQEDGPEGGENKALGIMLKMGFKIGQSLGLESKGSERSSPASPSDDERVERHAISSDPTHRAEPLPLNEWTGKKGIGLGKRARSPGASDRLAKMAKMAEDASKESFRDFARREFEERRAESRLTTAQRTCTTLDETAGITFNVLWINPGDADSIPKGLMDGVLEYTQDISTELSGRLGNDAARLRDQMRADALHPVADADDDDDDDVWYGHDGTIKATQPDENFRVETVQEATYFVRLGPSDRLNLVLAYLRDKYTYCFWCGTKYEDDSELAKHCPGPKEEDHD